MRSYTYTTLILILIATPVAALPDTGLWNMINNLRQQAQTYVYNPITGTFFQQIKNHKKLAFCGLVATALTGWAIYKYWYQSPVKENDDLLTFLTDNNKEKNNNHEQEKEENDKPYIPTSENVSAEFTEKWKMHDQKNSSYALFSDNKKTMDQKHKIILTAVEKIWEKALNIHIYYDSINSKKDIIETPFLDMIIKQLLDIYNKNCTDRNYKIELSKYPTEPWTNIWDQLQKKDISEVEALTKMLTEWVSTLNLQDKDNKDLKTVYNLFHRQAAAQYKQKFIRDFACAAIDHNHSLAIDSLRSYSNNNGLGWQKELQFTYQENKDDDLNLFMNEDENKELKNFFTTLNNPEISLEELFKLQLPDADTWAKKFNAWLEKSGKTTIKKKKFSDKKIEDKKIEEDISKKEEDKQTIAEKYKQKFFKDLQSSCKNKDMHYANLYFHNRALLDNARSNLPKESDRTRIAIIQRSLEEDFQSFINGIEELKTFFAILNKTDTSLETLLKLEIPHTDIWAEKFDRHLTAKEINEQYDEKMKRDKYTMDFVNFIFNTNQIHSTLLNISEEKTIETRQKYILTFDCYKNRVSENDIFLIKKLDSLLDQAIKLQERYQATLADIFDALFAVYNENHKDYQILRSGSYTENSFFLERWDFLRSKNDKKLVNTFNNWVTKLRKNDKEELEKIDAIFNKKTSENTNTRPEQPKKIEEDLSEKKEEIKEIEKKHVPSYDEIRSEFIRKRDNYYYNDGTYKIFPGKVLDSKYKLILDALEALWKKALDIQKYYADISKNNELVTDITGPSPLFMQFINAYNQNETDKENQVILSGNYSQNCILDACDFLLKQEDSTLKALMKKLNEWISQLDSVDNKDIKKVHEFFYKEIAEEYNKKFFSNLAYEIECSEEKYSEASELLSRYKEIEFDDDIVGRQEEVKFTYQEKSNNSLTNFIKDPENSQLKTFFTTLTSTDTPIEKLLALTLPDAPTWAQKLNNWLKQKKENIKLKEELNKIETEITSKNKNVASKILQFFESEENTKKLKKLENKQKQRDNAIEKELDEIEELLKEEENKFVPSHSEIIQEFIKKTESYAHNNGPYKIFADKNIDKKSKIILTALEQAWEKAKELQEYYREKSRNKETIEGPTSFCWFFDALLDIYNQNDNHKENSIEKGDTQSFKNLVTNLAMVLERFMYLQKQDIDKVQSTTNALIIWLKKLDVKSKNEDLIKIEVIFYKKIAKTYNDIFFSDLAKTAAVKKLPNAIELLANYVDWKAKKQGYWYKYVKFSHNENTDYYLTNFINENEELKTFFTALASNNTSLEKLLSLSIPDAQKWTKKFNAYIGYSRDLDEHIKQNNISPNKKANSKIRYGRSKRNLYPHEVALLLKSTHKSE